MTYIVEKKIGKGINFFEDDWSHEYKRIREDFLEYGELPSGYEALCITNSQTEAAIAYSTLEGIDSHLVSKLRECWPHLDWEKIRRSSDTKTQPMYTVLADIRAALGVGEKPMLSELPEIVRKEVLLKIHAVAALETILDNHDKLTAADCADIARGVLGGEK